MAANEGMQATACTYASLRRPAPPDARREPPQRERAIVKLGGTAQMDLRYSFTAGFIHAAALFVRRAYEIELRSAELIDEDNTAEHRGYVVAAIMKSVAALEAEIFEVMVHGPGHHLV